MTIAEGCAAPKVLPNRQAFYVDPEKGSMSNDGTLARPWRTLAEVLDPNRKLVATNTSGGPIRSGAIIYLNSGDHGDVILNGAANDEFITIQANPGQTPRLRALRVNNASKWMFVGLKIQALGDGSNSSSLVEIGRRGHATDIVFAGNSVSAADDTSAWTDVDWVRKPPVFGLLSSATCLSVSDNHFFNLRNAIQFDGQHTLVFGNQIDNFGSDGIDMIASHVVIRSNRITNGKHSKADPLHPDGIQGWAKNGVTNTDVLVDGNIVIKTGDPTISEMQGITIFDGKWERVTISNNVVVTNHWHGISISGVANGKIINNTVVAFDPERRPTWINVGKAKDGSLPVNLIVRNNITTRLVYTEEGVSADHNIVAKMISTTAAGKPVYFSKPGIYGNNNTVDPTIYSTLTLVDNARAMYDLRPAANSPALRNGSSSMAPDTDIVGRKRVAPIDIGAYAR